ncbi:MAG: class I SAM-dependent methyltransferase [Candidatus Korobacteraceae bacterium]
MSQAIDALSVVNYRTLALALRNPSKLRPYLLYCLKRYDDLAGSGRIRQRPPAPSDTDTISLPAAHSSGGMSFTELVILAGVTKSRKPKAVFEMGTAAGETTTVFILNAPLGARIMSLDLPLGNDPEINAARRLASVPAGLGLNNYTQLLCDSMVFDTAPYLGSIDLGLVDANHDFEHVRNDTIKMAQMMTKEGLVFWHDYGGKGALRPVATYLEIIAKHCPIYCVPETSLAWAHAKDLKRIDL